jgi:uncharacterized membrane protein YdbT with pleckstrin-like domain
VPEFRGPKFRLAKSRRIGRVVVMSDLAEQTIWKGSPSAATDFWLNLSCLLVLPIPWALWKWVVRRSHVMEITTERLRITQGIFSKRTDELELYRVRDTTFLQPFILRMCGSGSLQLNTDDATTPVVLLPGIPSDQSLRDQLRKAVEACRDRKRTRVSELGGTVDTDEPQPSA